MNGKRQPWEVVVKTTFINSKVLLDNIWSIIFNNDKDDKKCVIGFGINDGNSGVNGNGNGD